MHSTHSLSATRLLCVGRDDLCVSILEGAKRQGAVLLFGGRQCGKTTVFLNIVQAFRRSQISSHDASVTVPVFVDLMSAPYDATPHSIFHTMVASAVESCSCLPGFARNPTLATKTMSSVEGFAMDIQRIRSAASQYDLHFVFLVDEAKRILNSRFPAAFRDNLFSILYGTPAIAGRISMAFAGAQDLYAFCEGDTSPIASRAAFLYLSNLSPPNVAEILAEYNSSLRREEVSDIGPSVYGITGGQAALTVSVARDLKVFLPVLQTPERAIGELRARHVGLLRVWASSLSPQARMVQTALLRSHALSQTHIVKLLNEAGADVYSADQAVDELVFSGIADRTESGLRLGNPIYADFARAFVIDEPTNELERSTWSLIQNVELSLRRLIRKKYVEKWGAGADQKIEEILGPDMWSRVSENRRKSSETYRFSEIPTGTDVLDFTYLGQLQQLMICRVAWDLFKPLFRDKREYDDIMSDILPVRNDEAHFRKVPARELQRCKMRCEDLLAIVERQI